MISTATAWCGQWLALAYNHYTHANKLEKVLPITSKDIHNFLNIIYYSSVNDVKRHVYRPNRLTFVYTVVTQFPTLNYSHGWILLFWFPEEYIRTKVTKRTNYEYELFTRVHSAFLLRYATAS